MDERLDSLSALYIMSIILGNYGFFPSMELTLLLSVFPSIELTLLLSVFHPTI